MNAGWMSEKTPERFFGERSRTLAENERGREISGERDRDFGREEGRT